MKLRVYSSGMVKECGDITKLVILDDNDNPIVVADGSTGGIVISKAGDKHFEINVKNMGLFKPSNVSIMEL